MVLRKSTMKSPRRKNVILKKNESLQLPEIMESSEIPLPKVAIIGRPNVGKSTLFNRIVGTRKAIVDDRPGSHEIAMMLDAHIRGGFFNS